MKIAVVGLGYVGLTLSVLLSQNHEVIGLDIDPQKIKQINKGMSPFKDSELEKYLLSSDLKLHSYMYHKKYLKDVDCIVISTPTDYDTSKNKLNTSDLELIISECLQVNPKGYIVIKSTVPIGFTKSINDKFNTNRVIFSPEFLREGKALFDNLYPSRIILGGNYEYCQSFGNALSDVTKNNVLPDILSNPSEAEAIKLFSNSYLAMRIAFFNEVDSFSIAKKLNPQNIIEGICSDKRIGAYYNNPSFGYGGYCLPKDTKQILNECKGVNTNLLKSIVFSNWNRAKFITNEIISTGANTIGIYRLLAKTQSDNTRSSSTKNILKCLNEYRRQHKLNIVIYEPFLKINKLYGIKITSNLEEFKTQSDLIVANRTTNELSDVVEKVYTRDIFNRD